MFALEIKFKDGVSEPETIFVKRPMALIGASDYSHVVIDDMSSLDYQLKLVRGLGRSFKVKRVPRHEGGVAAEAESVHEGIASIDAGSVALTITSLDLDLAVREGESPDRAGVRVLRRAASTEMPKFPAISVGGAESIILSFQADQPIYIGRSKQCEAKLDAQEISAKHARIGYEAGEFWVEDLGSTNGTFVRGQQISGRTSFKPGEPVVLARDVTIIGLETEDQIQRAADISRQTLMKPAPELKLYPVLMSTSEVARPARCALTPGQPVFIGRDPQSDIWLGAPHVSRKHIEALLLDDGDVLITDHSTNGTSYGEGILRRGDELRLEKRPRVLDFGSGITVGICFSEADEGRFAGAQGAASAFKGGEAGLFGSSLSPIISSGVEFDRVERRLSGEAPVGAMGRMRLYFSAMGAAGKIMAGLGILALLFVLAFIVGLISNWRF